MRRNLLVLGLCATVLMGLAGCDGQQQGNGEKKLPRVALVMKSLANPFFKTMEEGARRHQREHPGTYELICNGIKDERDVAKQISIVEDMIGQKVDAIVIAPADSKSLVGVCKKAMDAGIVVVNIDNRFDGEALKEKGIRVPFIGPDNRKGARLAGECLAKQLKKGDKVAIVEGIPNTVNGDQRRLGFEDAMKAAEMEIAVSDTAHWETDKAMKLVSGMITQHTDLKAVLCANDSMALGAVAALKEAGKLDVVKVVGFDNITAIQQLMREGKVVCTIDQHGDQIAAFGIMYAIDILGDPDSAPSDKETPVDLITVKELPPAKAD